MRIHSLTIDNVRAVEHLELRDLPDTGVIVVHGHNEAGKSTILDAIDAVLNERHSGASKKIKVLAPVGRDASPEVTLTATVGETTFTIHKRWLKGKLSELEIHAPQHRNLTGRAADDELERILSEQMDTQLARTLFLRQGELEPGIAAAGIPSITKALEAESGDEHAGDEDTGLMQAIEAEYGKYWTTATPPKRKGTYAAKFDAVEQAEAELREQEDAVQRLAGFVDEVARREEEIRAVDAELPQAKEELATREAEFAAANKVKEQAQAAEERLARAAATRERATQDVADRKALAARVDALREEEAGLRDSLGPAQEASETEQGKIAEHTGALEAAKARVKEVRAEVKSAEAAREYARALRRLTVVREQLERIGTAEQAYEALLQSAPQRTVTDKQVRALEQAHSELTLQRRLRDAASAKLEITAAHATLTVDGDAREIDGTETVAVREGTRLGLGEFAVVFRAAQGASDPDAAVEQAERAYADALAATGCASVEEARDWRDACKAHEADLKGARQRLDDALAGAGADELRAERTHLTQQVDELREAAGGDGADAPAEEPADTAAAEQAAEEELKAAQAALAAAERDVESAEAALKPYADKTAANALTVLQTRLEAKESETALAAQELDKAEAAAPASALAEALEAATAEEGAAKAAATELNSQLAEADPEFAAQLLKGAQARLANLDARGAEARNRITELTGRIEIAAGAAEKADRAAAELEAAQTDLDRATRRAEAVKLLRETMLAHRDAARARYVAPFTDAIRNRARVLFGPTVDFNLGEDLAISERTVDGVTVPLKELSGGTKEQLAILTRFAIADLVSAGEAATPVPVIVDDALGATDPARLARMNSLFSQVGKMSQVLVLTCFPQRFDRVAAARTVSIDELKNIGGTIG